MLLHANGTVVEFVRKLKQASAYEWKLPEYEIAELESLYGSDCNACYMNTQSLKILGFESFTLHHTLLPSLQFSKI